MTGTEHQYHEMGSQVLTLTEVETWTEVSSISKSEDTLQL